MPRFTALIDDVASKPSYIFLLETSNKVFSTTNEFLRSCEILFVTPFGSSETEGIKRNLVNRDKKERERVRR